MPKKQFYPGYTNLSPTIPNHQHVRFATQSTTRSSESTQCNQLLMIKNIVRSNLNILFGTIGGNKITFFSVFTLVLMSYVVPDFVNRLQMTNELTKASKITGLISSEVSQAEISCAKAVTQLCQLYCSVNVGTENGKENTNLQACTNTCKQKRMPKKPQISNIVQVTTKENDSPDPVN